MYTRVFLFTLLFPLFGSPSKKEQIGYIFERAAIAIEQYPDSSLILLEEIPNPQSLKKSLYYQYYLLQIQAKYKNSKDITADSLIFTVRDYYKNKKKTEETALATFYCGRVYQEQKKYEEALQEFLETEQQLKQSKNINLKGLCQDAIGNLYYKQHLNNEAIVRFKKASEYFHLAQNHKNQVISMKFIGNSLLISGKIDSAFIYYNKGLSMADKYGIESQQIAIRQGLGVAYREIGRYEQAIYFFSQALTFSTDSLNNAKLTSNLARVYELQNKNDSAIYYLQKALTYLPGEHQNYLTANIYATWSAIEEKDKNYVEALDKYKLYNKHLAQIISDNKNDAILEVEKKYNFQLIENNNKQLLLERQRLLLFFLMLLLLASLLIIWLYRRAVTREQELREAEHKILQMHEMVSKYDERENSYKNVLIRHLDILKKTALLEKYLKEDERKKGEHLLLKFNEVVYGRKEMDWDLLFVTLNNAGNGIFEQLREQTSQLDESEFRICCLIYADFNNTEIALVLNYRLNTVEIKKGIIRRKLGIQSRGNIRNFLNNKNYI
ncbi:tetratricopeptide repeat protein [Maribellus sp. CM-23]|uniref:tetratricopeptide repeat protein n=1 Tax=Maribellus sp. CM-23 TaxID=2781026 RepID=UPI001F444806|nr:tetratricopeptide repeat protein [Maribellus sp. CM-23]MCE4564667.1 tetratricopeptide repeat protein [Maribellus sp. CM-23]